MKITDLKKQLNRMEKKELINLIGKLYKASQQVQSIEGIQGIAANDWSVYRQHLRDITVQPGFPFDIDWGTAPDAEVVTEE